MARSARPGRRSRIARWISRCCCEDRLLDRPPAPIVLDQRRQQARRRSSSVNARGQLVPRDRRDRRGASACRPRDASSVVVPLGLGDQRVEQLPLLRVARPLRGQARQRHLEQHRVSSSSSIVERRRTRACSPRRPRRCARSPARGSPRRRCHRRGPCSPARDARSRARARPRAASAGSRRSAAPGPPRGRAGRRAAAPRSGSASATAAPPRR